MSKAVIVSPKFDINKDCSVFNNELNQSLDFGDAKWKVTFGEMLYHPSGWFNVRVNHNTFDIEINNYLEPPIILYKIHFISWEYANNRGLPSIHRIEHTSTLKAETHLGYFYSPGSKDQYELNNPKPILRLYRFREMAREHVLADDEPDPNHERCKWKYFYVYDVYESEYNSNPLTQPYYFRKIDYTLQRTIIDGILHTHWIMANVDGNVRRGSEYRKSVRLYMPPKYYDEHLFALEFNELIIKGLSWIFTYPKPPGSHVYPINFHVDAILTPLVEMNTKMINNKMYTTIQIEDDYHKACNLRIKFHSSLAFQPGFAENLWQDESWISWAIDKTPMRVHDRHNIRTVLTYKTKTSDFVCDITRNTLRRMYIYSDVCKPIIVNDLRLSILRMVTIDSTAHIAYVVYPFEFRDIAKNHISNIKIWFTEDLFGEIPLILSPNLYIKLIFQKFDG